jgi:hypothetical protein
MSNMAAQHEKRGKKKRLEPQESKGGRLILYGNKNVKQQYFLYFSGLKNQSGKIAALTCV